jgi:enterochelin esterase family protein
MPSRTLVLLPLLVLSIGLPARTLAPQAQSAAPQGTASQVPRPKPPTRDPHTPGYVDAKELPDGTLPPPDADGNFIIGPTHPAAPELAADPATPNGAVIEFAMSSADSKFYPGIMRDPGPLGTPDPNDPAKLIVTTSHPAPWTRKVGVYVPSAYVPGSIAPFIVGADGIDRSLFTAVDGLVAAHKLPPMVVISIGNGGGDAQGSERGLEYDTLSPRYAEFVEQEVLPLVEKKAHVRLTRDPEARVATGGSSGAACAFTMAWYRNDLYHRVLAWSGTWINQQWPWNPETPHGAWEFPEHLVPNSPRKPIRIWMEVGDFDLYNPNVMRDGMHDWVLANENMARALAARGYHYQFVFAKNAGHVDHATRLQAFPEALEYVWQGYKAPTR